jgi:hypothetical protein
LKLNNLAFSICFYYHILEKSYISRKKYKKAP